MSSGSLVGLGRLGLRRARLRSRGPGGLGSRSLGVVLAAGFLAGALVAALGAFASVALSAAFSGRNDWRQVASMSSSWSRSLLTCSLAPSRSTFAVISSTTLPSLIRSTTFWPSTAQLSMVFSATLPYSVAPSVILVRRTVTPSPTLRAATTGAPTVAYRTLFACIATPSWFSFRLPSRWDLPTPGTCPLGPSCDSSSVARRPRWRRRHSAIGPPHP